jgi:RNA polymerase sigma-70 factor (ECF subfamily)
VLASTIADHNRGAWRRSRREADLDADDPRLVAPVADEDVDGAICPCLYKLLPTLRPAHADVIWRAELLGDGRARVASDLGITVTNLNVRLLRARRALKKRLQEMCLTCPVEGFFDCHCEPRAKARARAPGRPTSGEPKVMNRPRQRPYLRKASKRPRERGVGRAHGHECASEGGDNDRLSTRGARQTWRRRSRRLAAR